MEKQDILAALQELQQLLTQTREEVKRLQAVEQSAINVANFVDELPIVVDEDIPSDVVFILQFE